MSKYIKLNAAIRILWELGMPLRNYESGAKQLESLPTIDIVHCKDCRFSKVYRNDSNGVEGRFCEAFTLMRIITDEDYCSYGERKEE